MTGQDKGEHPLELIFHPRSIAVVGVSTEENPRLGQGRSFIQALQLFKFPGPIYPVNPKATGPILGLPTYPTVRDIPGPLDQVIFCIPAAITPRALQECAAKGVRAVQFFTAGFSETGEPGRAALEGEILKVIRDTGLRVIGPNCMGLYYPRGGLSWQDNFPLEPGPVGVFSQSGGNASEIADLGGARGIRFSKIVSYGNALDINEADLLEYFLQDPETGLIAAYIEGARDGPRFLKLLQGASKPLVLLKGGHTEAGARATSSHTGSLAGPQALWDALCRQKGVIQVDSLEEMADVLLALLFLRPPRGRRMGLVGIGGGASVHAADACLQAGLLVPPLSSEVQRDLRAFTPEAGTIIRNPVDSPTMMASPDDFVRTIKLVASCPDIDVLLVHLPLNLMLDRGTIEPALEAIIRGGREIDKPLAVVLRRAFHPGRAEAVFQLQGRLQGAGIPVFYSVNGAAHALARLIWYYNEEKGSPVASSRWGTSEKEAE